MEDDDVDLRDVKHAQGYGGAQAHGHGQSGGLDEHLRQETGEVIINQSINDHRRFCGFSDQSCSDQ